MVEPAVSILNALIACGAEVVVRTIVVGLNRQTNNPESRLKSRLKELRNRRSVRLFQTQYVGTVSDVSYSCRY